MEEGCRHFSGFRWAVPVDGALFQCRLICARIGSPFSHQNLYKSLKIVENYTLENANYNRPYSFQGETFMHYCEKEQSEKTFELELTDNSKNWWGKTDGFAIPESLFDLNGNLNFIEHFTYKKYKFKKVCIFCKA